MPRSYASGVERRWLRGLLLRVAVATHERAINQLADLGVVRGVTSTSYAPAAPVTRAQMATFLIRAYQVSTDTSLPAGEDRFVDDDTSVHEGRINQAAASGFTTGVTADSYRPELAVRRDQMASYVTRVLQTLHRLWIRRAEVLSRMGSRRPRGLEEGLTWSVRPPYEQREPGGVLWRDEV